VNVRNGRARVSLTLNYAVGPSLPGAACTGKAPMFDDWIHGEPAEDREARLQEARKVCRGCPVWAGCLARRIEMERGLEPVAGVWAGEVLVPGHIVGGVR